MILREALDWRRHISPDAKNILGIAEAIYALTLADRGRFDEAENKITEALQIYRQSSKPQYTNYPPALIIHGLVLNRKNQFSEAEKVLREAHNLRLDSLPKEHFWVSLAEEALGECLMTQNKLAEAGPLLQESYENLKQSQGVENPRTLAAPKRLNTLEQEKAR